MMETWVIEWNWLDSFWGMGVSRGRETRGKKPEQMADGGGIDVRSKRHGSEAHWVDFFPVLLPRHLVLAASDFSSVRIYMSVCVRHKKQCLNFSSGTVRIWGICLINVPFSSFFICFFYTYPFSSWLALSCSPCTQVLKLLSCTSESAVFRSLLSPLFRFSR